MAQIENKLVLFSGEYVKVIAVNCSSPSICISFFYFHHEVGSFPEFGYCERSLSRNGITGIYFLNSDNHWWQVDEMKDAIESVKEYIANYHPSYILTCGGSMGGYGALLFAKTFNADRCFAVSPQIDIWTEPEDKRWVAYAEKWPRIFPPVLDLQDHNCEYILLFDRFLREDNVQANLFPSAIHLSINFAGHSPDSLLSRCGGFWDIVTTVARGERVDSMRKIIRNCLSKRRKDEVYILNLLDYSLMKSKHTLVKGLLGEILLNIQKRGYLQFNELADKPRFIKMVRSFGYSRLSSIFEKRFSRSLFIKRVNKFLSK